MATKSSDTPKPARQSGSYRFVGEQELVFSGLQHPDGRTVQLKPGETVVLEHDPEHPLLKPVTPSS